MNLLLIKLVQILKKTTYLYKLEILSKNISNILKKALYYWKFIF